MTNNQTIIDFAIALCVEIEKIHEKGEFHGSINAYSLLTRENGEFLELIDSGNMVQMPYISPEQTGRLNMKVDYRTDFYSLGVCLYKRVTGKFPFENQEDEKLIHAIIAQTPKEPCLLVENVSPAFSSVIMKLLSKNPNERYYSISGLLVDLRKIKLSSPEDLIDFIPGERDFSSQIFFPEKIYGRENQLEKIETVYRSLKKDIKIIVALVGSYGVGKTAVVEKKLSEFASEGDIIFRWKFVQQPNPKPYAALIVAIQNFVNGLLLLERSQLFLWKSFFLQAFGQIGRVLITLVPDFELIIGSQPDLPKLEGIEAQNRFNYSLLSFFKVLASTEKRLIVFIDNYHLVDDSSKVIINNLLNNRDLNNSLFLITHEKNTELSENKEIPYVDDPQNLHEIQVNNLTPKNLHELVLDVVSPVNNKAKLMELAALVFSKTFGNIFFTMQFLKKLNADGLLVFDKEQLSWVWKSDEIKKLAITDNVADLLKPRLELIPPVTKLLMQIGACRGLSFGVDVLEHITGKSETEVKEALKPAVYESLLEEGPDNSYRFTHQSIFNNTYSSLLIENKRDYHAKIGVFLFGLYRTRKRLVDIFEVAQQINKSDGIISEEMPDELLVRINYVAGYKAFRGAAHFDAYKYLLIAKNAFKNEDWTHNIDFVYKVVLKLAEVATIIGKPEVTHQMVNQLLERIQDFNKRTTLWVAKINCMVSQQRFSDAVKTGLGALSELGLNVPETPTNLHLFLGLVKLDLFYRLKGEDVIDNLPDLKDEKILARFRVIDAFGSSMFATNSRLFAYLNFLTNIIILKQGHNFVSPFFLCTSAIILIRFNRVKQAIKIGELAIKQLYRLNLAKIRCKQNYLTIIFLKSWNTPLPELIPQLYRNYQDGLETGDFEFSGYSLLHYFYNAFQTGEKIKDLKEKLLEHNFLMDKVNQEFVRSRYLMLLQLFDILLDEKTDDFESLTGIHFDETRAIEEAERNGIQSSLATYYLFKLQMLYVFGKTDKYEVVLERLVENKEVVRGYNFDAFLRFYQSLCLLELFPDKSIVDSKKNVKTIKDNIKFLKKWAVYCPETYLHKYKLLLAEYNIAVTKDYAKAVSCFDEAINSVGQGNYYCEEAIIFERIAKFYHFRNNQIQARHYFLRCMQVWSEWGAESKCRQLLKLYPFYLKSKNQTPLKQNIDLKAWMKISELLVQELSLSGFVVKFLRIAIENAGAESGHIILKENESWVVITHKIDSMGLSATEIISTPLAGNPNLPENLMNYVIGTNRPVILGNASTSAKFALENYIKTHNLKSVLCQPLNFHNNLLGVLYLEHNSTPNVFTDQRGEFIRTLCSQAAVVLNNIYLYENLERKVLDRTKKYEEANTKLMKLNETLNTEIEDRKKAEKLLQELNVGKDKMFSIIAHDLKNPFNIIINYADMLTKRYNLFNDKKRIEYLSFIKNSARNAYVLLENLLTWARSQQNRITYNYVEFSVEPFVREVVLLSSQVAKNKEINLKTKISHGLKAYGDKETLKTVLRNLVSNAMKFSQREQTILISAESFQVEGKRKCYVKFAVTDNGIGIPEEKVSKLFALEVESTLGTENEKGTGLGLVLCKEFVEKNNGTIGAQSIPDVETSFWFTVPCLH